MPEEIEIKSYKVLKQLGWKGGTYSEGDIVEMEPRFAEYYLNEKVLKEAPPETSAQERFFSDELFIREETSELLDKEALPVTASQNIPTPTPTTEPEAS